MNRRDDMAERPSVEGTLVPMPGFWLVQVTCPYCHKDHQHNAGKTGAGAQGYRLAACGPEVELPHPRAGYYIFVNSGNEAA